MSITLIDRRAPILVYSSFYRGYNIMDELIFWLVIAAVATVIVFGIMSIDGNKPQIYFIEKVKCTVDDENVHYTFKKNRVGDFSTAEYGAVNIKDENGYPIRTLTNNAKCDITFKKMIDDGND